jgi:hypothetical protein
MNLKAIQRSLQRLIRIKRQAKWMIYERIARQIIYKRNGIQVRSHMQSLQP